MPTSMSLYRVPGGFKLLLAIIACGSAHAAPSLEQQVTQASRAWLDGFVQKQQLRDARIDVTVLPGRGPVPVCTEPFDITPADTTRLKRMRFAARCPGSARAALFVVRAEVQAKVLVASAPIPAGKVIDRADVLLAERDIAATPDAIHNADDIAGRASRRPLRAGQVVQSRFLRGAQTLKRGQPVRIVARSQRIEVTAAGVAMQNGGENDVIQVRNVATGKIISARVTDASTVTPVASASSAAEE